MESTGLEQCFWHYFFLVKPLRPAAFFSGGISWWFPLQAGSGQAETPANVREVRPAGASAQSRLQHGRVLVCPTILALVRTQILCCSMCGKQSVSFMSGGAKLVFYVVNSLKDRLQLCCFPPLTWCCWASHTAMSLRFNYATEVKKD